MPAVLPISLNDCVRSKWVLRTTCDHCRKGSQPVLERLAKLPGVDRPLTELFDAGKLTCNECGKALSGLEVWRHGPTPLDETLIARYWRPGSLSDPEVAAYWRGFREAKGR